MKSFVKKKKGQFLVLTFNRFILILHLENACMHTSIIIGVVNVTCHCNPKLNQPLRMHYYISMVCFARPRARKQLSSLTINARKFSVKEWMSMQHNQLRNESRRDAEKIIQVGSRSLAVPRPQGQTLPTQMSQPNGEKEQKAAIQRKMNDFYLNLECSQQKQVQQKKRDIHTAYKMSKATRIKSGEDIRITNQGWV